MSYLEVNLVQAKGLKPHDSENKNGQFFLHNIEYFIYLFIHLFIFKDNIFIYLLIYLFIIIIYY